MKLIATLILLMVVPLATALADAPPVPGRKTLSLNEIQKNLNKEKAEKSVLERSLSERKNDLDGTRTELVRIADDVRKNEKNLDRLEQKIETLSRELDSLTTTLEQDYGTIGGLVLALERMRRIPPESLIVRPGAPLQTAQSAMLLRSALPAIHARADHLSAQLSRLRTVEETLEKDRAAALSEKTALEQKKKDIAALSRKREDLYGKTQQEYAAAKRNIERLSKESKNLMDLMANLEHEKNRKPAPNQDQSLIVYNNDLPDPGQARLPVSGQITEGYGQKNDIGATSQGLTIESRPGALAVAPMAGVVRFAGTFKNYGNMVIIEHKNGYHSLIAGMGRIDAAAQSPVKAGEPVGQLPLTSSRGGRPALYYELRRNGRPVDPATKFSGLKS